MRKYADGPRRVVDAILGAIRPGVTSAELCEIAEQAIDEIWFRQFRRPLSNVVGNEKDVYFGHGIGFSVNE